MWSQGNTSPFAERERTDARRAAPHSRMMEEEEEKVVEEKVVEEEEEEEERVRDSAANAHVHAAACSSGSQQTIFSPTENRPRDFAFNACVNASPLCPAPERARFLGQADTRQPRRLRPHIHEPVR